MRELYSHLASILGRGRGSFATASSSSSLIHMPRRLLPGGAHSHEKYNEHQRFKYLLQQIYKRWWLETKCIDLSQQQHNLLTLRYLSLSANNSVSSRSNSQSSCPGLHRHSNSRVSPKHRNPKCHHVHFVVPKIRVRVHILYEWNILSIFLEFPWSTYYETTMPLRISAPIFKELCFNLLWNLLLQVVYALSPANSRLAGMVLPILPADHYMVLTDFCFHMFKVRYMDPKWLLFSDQPTSPRIWNIRFVRDG